MPFFVVSCCPLYNGPTVSKSTPANPVHSYIIRHKQDTRRQHSEM